MCEMVEYASIRSRLVCAIATTLPSAMEATASTASICDQSAVIPCRPLASSRIMKAKVAIFGAAPTISVAGVAAPW